MAGFFDGKVIPALPTEADPNRYAILGLRDVEPNLGVPPADNYGLTSTVDGIRSWTLIPPIGPQGPQGPQGAQGIAGPQGAQGDQGNTGPQGAQGPQGGQGNTGPQGAQGPQGGQGEQGIAGPQGAQGPQGGQGEQGIAGPQGAQGPQGETGPTGAGGLERLDNISGGFNGSTVTFTLTYLGGTTLPSNVTADGLVLFIGGAVQSTAAFSWNSALSQVTFSTAPPAGDYFVGFVGNSSGGGSVTGTVIWSSASTAPIGYVACNGAAVSRTTYSNLFAVIGTTYGNGDGSTTFNLPDLRGEFIRGWDAGRGVDPGRVFGSSQLDDFESHTHDTTYAYGFDFGSTGRAGGGANSVQTYNTSQAINATGGTETRPRNVALLPCIKF